MCGVDSMEELLILQNKITIKARVVAQRYATVKLLHRDPTWRQQFADQFDANDPYHNVLPEEPNPNPNNANNAPNNEPNNANNANAPNNEPNNANNAPNPNNANNAPNNEPNNANNAPNNDEEDGDGGDGDVVVVAV